MVKLCTKEKFLGQQKAEILGKTLQKALYEEEGANILWMLS